jgi:hypothetical protein
MITEQYIWLTWAAGFLVPWLLLFGVFPRYRGSMLWASLFTTPFGLTEPLFVPEYWSPPSLFDLARRTGFDVESLIFCFAIGGVSAVLYDVLTGQQAVPAPLAERESSRHRLHRLALLAPFLTFPPLYFLPWNPIYPSIAAMAVGAAATIACRPDLKSRSWVGGLLFLIYYIVFLQGLRWTSPGFIERVWNLEALSGTLLLGMPLEELLFAGFFGMYWSSVYEHFNWMRPAPRAAEQPPPAMARGGVVGHPSP